MFNWIKNKWASFEAWVASMLPGWKVKFINGVSAVGVLATALGTYLASVPLADLVEHRTLLIVLFVVNTLSYWLKDIGPRVAARDKAVEEKIKVKRAKKVTA